MANIDPIASTIPAQTCQPPMSRLGALGVRAAIVRELVS